MKTLSSHNFVISAHFSNKSFNISEVSIDKTGTNDAKVIMRQQFNNPTQLEYQLNDTEFIEVQNRRRSKVEAVCEQHKLSWRNTKIFKAALVADVDGKFIFCNNYKVK